MIDTRIIEVPAERPLRVAVVADTHSRPHERTYPLLRALKPDYVLHAGDIGDLKVLDDLARIAPLIAIRGNIDEHAPQIPENLSLEFRSNSDLVLRALLTHIAVYGPKLHANIRKNAQQIEARMVICGHSHVPLIARDRDITIFNPGSAGPRRFQLPIVFGMMNVSTTKVSMEHVSCETGATWEPPGPARRA